MPSPEDTYFDFASKISFYEFIQEEFRNTKIKPEDYTQEISALIEKQSWNIDELSDYVKKYPRSFVIFQEIFQLLRFTNTQLIHFVFDVVKLNSTNLDALFEYLILNLKHDSEFRTLFLKLLEHRPSYASFMENVDNYNKKRLIATFKLAVSKYIDKIAKDFDILEKRCSKREFEDFSIRFSNYLLNNLKLNNTLSSINVENFIRHKRIPVDTKGIHGKFLKLKILRVLRDNGFINIDSALRRNAIKALSGSVKSYIAEESGDSTKLFCTERFVEGLIKPKDRKPKRFDLIIFSDYKPSYLFEMNFYTTAGTKIGINQGEYVDLNNFIKENFDQYKFHWITDGNYWLTSEGKERFLNLLNHFDKVLNINLFAENLAEFR